MLPVPPLDASLDKNKRDKKEACLEAGQTRRQKRHFDQVAVTHFGFLLSLMMMIMALFGDLMLLNNYFYLFIS